jgi:drug/metabolite transporter (DMT)-like permease
MVQGDVLLGVAVAAAAAACFDGAVILQAGDARQMAAAQGLRLSLLRRLATRRRWLAGTAIAVVGWPLQLVAFALAPVAVVQPTLALGTLVLLAGGSRMLGERVGAREWAAAGAIIVGVGVIAVAAPTPTDHVPSVGAAALAAGGLVAVMALPFVLGVRRNTAWTLIVAAGCAFALTALTGKLVTVELAADRTWVALAAAGATALVAGTGMLIDMTALQRFPATRVAPPMFVLETIIPVALSTVLFDERWGATPGGGALLGLGLLLVLTGGGVLGASRPVAGFETGPGRGERQDPVGGSGQARVGGVGPPR